MRERVRVSDLSLALPGGRTGNWLQDQGDVVGPGLQVFGLHRDVHVLLSTVSISYHRVVHLDYEDCNANSLMS